MVMINEEIKYNENLHELSDLKKLEIEIHSKEKESSSIAIKNPSAGSNAISLTTNHITENEAIELMEIINDWNWERIKKNEKQMKQKILALEFEISKYLSKKIG